MLRRGRILVIGLALIVTITLVTGNLCAQPPTPGGRYFWIPITISGTATVQETGSGVPVEKFKTKTVQINNAWIIADIWYIVWGNPPPVPSKATLYFDGKYVMICNGKVGAYDSSCTDVTSYLTVSLKVANTNGTWSGQYNQDTQNENESGHYLAEIYFYDGFINWLQGYGVISEKFNVKYDPNTHIPAGKDTISLKANGEGYIDNESITFSITVSGSGPLIFF